MHCMLLTYVAYYYPGLTIILYAYIIYITFSIFSLTVESRLSDLNDLRQGWMIMKVNTKINQKLV